MSEVRLAGLKSRRIAMGLSMRALAALVGVTFTAVAGWESGQKMPTADKLPMLARALDCSMEELFTAPAEIEVKEAEDHEDEGEDGIFGAVRRTAGRTRSDAEGRGEARL